MGFFTVQTAPMRRLPPFHLHTTSDNPGQNIWNKVKKFSKLGRVRKLWYLFLCTFWLLLQNFNFWNEDWALDHVSTQTWKFSNNSEGPKIVSLSSLATREARHLLFQVCYTRYQGLFHLWRTGPALKHCKVPKYYDQ